MPLTVIHEHGIISVNRCPLLVNKNSTDCLPVRYPLKPFVYSFPEANPRWFLCPTNHFYISLWGSDSSLSPLKKTRATVGGENTLFIKIANVFTNTHWVRYLRSCLLRKKSIYLSNVVMLVSFFFEVSKGYAVCRTNNLVSLSTVPGVDKILVTFRPESEETWGVKKSMRVPDPVETSQE